MIAPSFDRTDAHTAAPTLHAGTAAQDAERERTPVIALHGKAGPNAFDRMSAYMRKEYASFGKDRKLTREQLLSRLEKATDGDQLLCRQSASLRLLIASDIQDAEGFPIPGAPDAIARPMRAWRQRYNGLGRFLPRPSGGDFAPATQVMDALHPQALRKECRNEAGSVRLNARRAESVHGQ